MPKDQVADIVMKHGLPRSTQNTIGSIKKLEVELAKTRDRGFAIDNEEFVLGLRCVAAPILDDRGIAHAALSVAGPKARMTDERLAALGKLVAAAAYSATVELGGVNSGQTAMLIVRFASGHARFELVSSMLA